MKNKSKSEITHTFHSALGQLCMVIKDDYVTRLDFCDRSDDHSAPDSAISSQSQQQSNINENHPHPYLNQLTQYFENDIKEFDLPLKLNGTPFQKDVWKQIANIPFGTTKTYGEIATLVGNKNSVRAVGRAVGANPVSIIIPCHRVVGSNGKLTGYSGGLWRKKWLLHHEKVILV